MDILSGIFQEPTSARLSWDREEEDAISWALWWGCLDSD